MGSSGTARARAGSRAALAQERFELPAPSGCTWLLEPLRGCEDATLMPVLSWLSQLLASTSPADQTRLRLLLAPTQACGSVCATLCVGEVLI